ncbi:MAG TPA: endonuclease/exonuclease/phosphatase family protein [Pirellulaceae bacterium]|jgi:endonuclease/exonuclease/phosphatase family metal-dependent hydrolase|nr:endonuclease/exonuclease/phosphatase family protein [Pirellulaceae bacterium]
MRAILIPIFLATTFAPFMLSPARADEPTRIRVLSYNIHHGEGTDGKLDLARIAKVIEEAKPDVVALQEVDVETERTGKVDQAQELARLTKLHVAFGSSMDFQGGQYGNAVLSRWPIVSSKVHPLPRFGEGEPRSVFVCEIDLPDQEEGLSFFATHFGFFAGTEERLASVDAVEEIAKTPPSRLAILAGDFNDVPDGRPILKLREAWTLTTDDTLPTVPVKQPTRQIDFIFYRPAQRWRVVETRVLDEAVASDHRAILAELELLPAE